MPTKILNTDIMILQKEGDFSYLDENHHPNGGPYGKLKYDLNLFHYTGADLKFTVEEYMDEYHKYVRLDGDEMTGNLSIAFPSSSTVEQSTPAQLTLKGRKAGNDVYSNIAFTNQASGTGFTMSIGAIHSNDNKEKNYFKIGNEFNVTNDGKIFLGGRHICSDDQGGFLSYTTDATWDKSTGVILSTIEPNNVRVRWTDFGGGLRNSNNIDVFKWTAATGQFRDPVSNHLIASYEDGKLLYSGPETDDNEVVTKKYIDDQDHLYVPLKGTRDRSEYVFGPIDFVYEDSIVGALNGSFGSSLVLTYDDDIKMSIGGKPGQNSDGKIYLHDTLDFDNQVGDNVPYPATEHGVGTPIVTPEDDHVVPRKYVDDQDDKLKEIIDDVLGGANAPVGMINAYVGTSDPPGWFICDGRSYNTTTYGQLFAVLGKDTLPDLSGRFLAQHGGGLGSIGQLLGARTGKPANWAISSPPHKHTMDTQGSHRHDVYVGSGKAGYSHRGNSDSHIYAVAGTSESNDWVKAYRNSIHGQSNTLIKSDGAHAHSINNTTLTFSTTWDDHTRPKTYTINWIIRHD